MTEFIELTELWSNNKYYEVGRIIKEENWDQSRVAKFCSYFAKYIGLKELNILYKFL